LYLKSVSKLPLFKNEISHINNKKATFPERRKDGLILSNLLPYDGINRIRFKGYALKPEKRATPAGQNIFSLILNIDV